MALNQLMKVLIRKNKWFSITSEQPKRASHRFSGQNNNQRNRLDEVRRQCFREEQEQQQNENCENEETSEVNSNDEEIEQVLSKPADYVDKRTVRIYKRLKDPELQAGSKPSYLWEVDFVSNEGEEDVSGENLKLQFTSMDAAVNFIKKHGWEWSLDTHRFHPYEAARENPWPRTAGDINEY